MYRTHTDEAGVLNIWTLQAYRCRHQNLFTIIIIIIIIFNIIHIIYRWGRGVFQV